MKICILSVQRDTCYDLYDSCAFISSIPDFMWKEVTEEEYQVYSQYVNIKNKKLEKPDISYMLVVHRPYKEIELDFDFENAKSVVEKAQKAKEIMDAKRKLSQEKSNLTREINKIKRQIVVIEESQSLSGIDCAESISKLKEKVKKLQAKKDKM